MTQTFAIGNTVRLTKALPYVKTAEAKPMLRPGNLVAVTEEGTIMSCHPANVWGVKFSSGTFLMDAENLEIVTE